MSPRSRRFFCTRIVEDRPGKVNLAVSSNISVLGVGNFLGTTVGTETVIAVRSAHTTVS